MERELEGQVGVGCVCGACNGGVPVEEILGRGRKSGDTGSPGTHYLHEFCLEAVDGLASKRKHGVDEECRYVRVRRTPGEPTAW